MIFANATYLWGLLGLLLPIAIHLWSHRKVKTIKVGSTKLLQASEPKQTSSIKLNELWLLFLRLLTIFLLVFILTEPNILRREKNVAVNYLIEPGLLNDERIGAILDTVSKASVRILEDGFPKWDDYDFEKPTKTISYWQLAQQMSSIQADSLVIFSKGLMKGLKGARPTIKANTRWIVFEPNGINQQALEVTHKESYAEVLSVSSRVNILAFKKDTISLNDDLIEISPRADSVRLSQSNSKDWMSLKKNAPIRIGILEPDSLRTQVRYLQAAYRGISRFLNRPIAIEILKGPDGVSDYDFNMLVSFDKMIPVASGVNFLIYRPNELANQLIEKGPKNNIFHLTRPLDNENIVAEHLPEKLLKLLNLHRNLEDIVNSNDIRVLAENELQPLKSEEERLKNTASLFEITPWLWLFFILVVVVERILSKLRKQ